MLIGKKREIVEKRSVVEQAVCDRCGLTFLWEVLAQTSRFGRPPDSDPEIESNICAQLPGTFRFEGNYFSNWDGQEWLGELCPDCTLAVFDFINAGPGPGVQVDRSWSGPSSPAGDETWCSWAPFDTAKLTHTGKRFCSYHQQEELQLERSGLRCRVAGCPELVDYINKDDLEKIESDEAADK